MLVLTGISASIFSLRIWLSHLYGYNQFFHHILFQRYFQFYLCCPLPPLIFCPSQDCFIDCSASRIIFLSALWQPSISRWAFDDSLWASSSATLSFSDSLCWARAKLQIVSRSLTCRLSTCSLRIEISLMLLHLLQLIAAGSGIIPCSFGPPKLGIVLGLWLTLCS